MTSADLRTHLDGERAFLRLCFHRQPDQTTFDRLLGAAALASWQMQASIPSMSIVTEGLSKARVPVLLIYGAQDALVLAQSAIARASALNSRVRSRLYAGSGHAPFIEEPQRFNHDLTEFVESTAR